MGKKNPLLFTIQFTAGLPMHEQAAAFLGQCGRHKASIIAEALNMYLSQDRCQREPLRVPVPEPLSVPAPMPVPEPVVQQVIANTETAAQNPVMHDSPNENVVEAEEKAGEESTDFSSDDLALICGALSAFDEDDD